MWRRVLPGCFILPQQTAKSPRMCDHFQHVFLGDGVINLLLCSFFSVGSVLETWKSVTAIESLPSTKNLTPLCPSTRRVKGRSRVQGVGVGSSSVLSYFIVIDKALPCYCASLGVT